MGDTKKKRSPSLTELERDSSVTQLQVLEFKMHPTELAKLADCRFQKSGK